MGNLEEQIRKNREDLDRYTPPEGTWRKIEKELKKDKRLNRQWISIAAMVVVIFGTAVVLFRPVYRWTDNKKNIDNVTAENPQLKETEIYYNNLVNTLYKEATPLLTNNPEAKKELNTDLSHLDSICIDLKKDLKDNISNQEVVEALIRNYRIKIQILEEMVTVLKENENSTEKKNRHEL
jgi:cytoskeletal protein RodZ